MNSTNRALNRIFLMLTGLVLVVIGAGLIAVAAVPAVASAYTDVAPGVADSIRSALRASPVFDLTVSWISVAAVAALLLLLVLLIAFALRQGRGRTGSLLTERTSDRDETVIDTRVAEQSIEDALATHSEFAASSVSAYRIAGRSVLKVSVTVRRGVAPGHAVALVEDTLDAFEALLGSELPALVSVAGGFRARAGNGTIVN